MAEKSVLWRENQEVQADDLNNMQDFLGDAIDHIVLDCIEDGSAYSGFTVTKSDATTVSVASGRLYSAGKVYAYDDVSELDAYSLLPVSQQKYLAVVAWSTTVQEDTQPRDFVIDDSGAYQPQTVAMQETRHANLGFVAGIEDSSPQYPTLNVNQLLIAYVLCDSTGITTITQSTDGQIASVSGVNDAVKLLQGWQSQVTGTVNTLQTALSNMAAKFSNYVTVDDYTKLISLTSQLQAEIDQLEAAAYSPAGTDYYLSEEQSYTDGDVDGDYAAKVEEGLRFPGPAPVTTTLSLLNPQDPTVTTSGHLTLPMPSGNRTRLDCTFRTPYWYSYPYVSFSSDLITQYVYLTPIAVRLLSAARARYCCGYPFLPCPPSQVWWYQAQLDPSYRILSFVNETWEIIEWREVAAHRSGDCYWPTHLWDRYRYYWRDWVDVYYWGKVYYDYSHTGQHVSQSFINSQDGWLTGITFLVYRGTNFPFDLIVTECDEDGTPNHHHKTIARVSYSAEQAYAASQYPVLIGDIDVDPTYWGTVSWTWPYSMRVQLPPTFLQAGKRYAFHIITASAMYLCVTNDWRAFGWHQGAFWVSGSSGLYLWPGLTSPKSLMFKLHYAVWGQWQHNVNATGGGVRRVIDFNPLQMVGGINGVEILTHAVESSATSLTYQVQVGGVWQPFDADPDNPQFSSNPALVPLQVVCQGTTDLMPAFAVGTDTQVTLHGPSEDDFHHISKQIEVASTMTKIKVKVTVHGFDDAHHTLECNINHDSNLLEANDSATIEDIDNDDGSLQRTWTWTSISITDDFYIELDGHTDGVGDRFIVAQRTAFVGP